MKPTLIEFASSLEKEKITSLMLIPQTQEETLVAITSIRRKLKSLHKDVEVKRKALREKERIFLSLANHKLTLERRLVKVGRILPLRERKATLLKRLESLSEVQFEKLRNM